MDSERLSQIRKQKGFEIANHAKITSQNGIWLVPSKSHPDKNYIVTLGLGKSTCTCEDYRHSTLPCKHIFAVQFRVANELDKHTPKIEERPTYPQDWPNYDKAQTQQKELFMKLLNDLVQNISDETKPKRAGRPELSMRDMIFSSALKIFTTFSLRRFMTDVRDARAKDYIHHIPHFTLISVYMKKREMTPILQDLVTLSAMPLKTVETQFAIDSTGFRTTRFTEYCNERHKLDKHHEWLKVHLCCGVKTNIVTAVNITDKRGSDALQFIPLATQTHEIGFNMQEVSADKAYSSAANMRHIVGYGGTAFIPFRSNTITPNSSHPYIWKKMYNYFVYNRDEFLQHYHLRSNVETTNFMLKAKFMDMIRSKDETAQINEVLLKVLCHNICVLISEMFELGIQPEFIK
jgi:transposase